MPVVKETPAGLKAFRALGLELDGRSSDQAVGDCPFCGREGKFHADPDTGLWQCKVCGEEGNPLTFLRKFYALCTEAAVPAGAYERLAADRRLLDPNTLREWGVVRSVLTGDWLVPGYAADGDLHQVYRYLRIQEKGRWVRRLLPVPGVWEDGKAHGLFGAHHYNPDKPLAYLCEGPWDGMAWWEVLRRAKRGGEGGLGLTGNENLSLYATANVLATPGCNVFSEAWLPLFTGKGVTLLYDNDHPRAHPQTGALVEGGGLVGTRRVARTLLSAREPPADVRYLKWGSAGYDPELPSGHDVRDWLSAVEGGPGRVARCEELLSRVVDAPIEWRAEAGRRAGPKRTSLEPLPCKDFRTLVASFRKALRWTGGLNYGLAVALATAAPVRVVGDQLWTMFISPPSTGKSAIALALGTSRKYVHLESVFKGFYSGYQIDKEGSENLSFVNRLRDKAFVVKDGDSLLTLPNRQEILGQARDLYDTTGSASFKNKMSARWDDMRFAWLLFGTKSLRALDHSELGQRFLVCRIMDDIDDDLEEEICWRKINQVRNNRFEVNGQPEEADTPEMVEAKCLAGGYVDYLRANVGRLYARVAMSDEAARECLRLAKFISYLRARPSKIQDEESSSRELAARLTSQLGKLAHSLAVVLNKTGTDDEVMGLVRRVALDSARGQTLTLAKHLFRAGRAGADSHALSNHTRHAEDADRKLLKFLQELRAVESFQHKANGLRSVKRWRLTDRVRDLYGEVVGDG